MSDLAPIDASNVHTEHLAAFVARHGLDVTPIVPLGARAMSLNFTMRDGTLWTGLPLEITAEVARPWPFEDADALASYAAAMIGVGEGREAGGERNGLHVDVEKDNSSGRHVVTLRDMRERKGLAQVGDGLVAARLSIVSDFGTDGRAVAETLARAFMAGAVPPDPDPVSITLEWEGFENSRIRSPAVSFEGALGAASSMRPDGAPIQALRLTLEERGAEMEISVDDLRLAAGIPSFGRALTACLHARAERDLSEDPVP